MPDELPRASRGSSAFGDGPEISARSVLRPFLLGRLAAALLGMRPVTAAAPVPVADLVEGLRPAFAYSSVRVS